MSKVSFFLCIYSRLLQNLQHGLNNTTESIQLKKMAGINKNDLSLRK